MAVKLFAKSIRSYTASTAASDEWKGMNKLMNTIAYRKRDRKKTTAMQGDRLSNGAFQHHSRKSRLLIDHSEISFGAIDSDIDEAENSAERRDH